MIDICLQLLDKYEEDMTFILTAQTADELTDALCDMDLEYAQPIEKVINTIDENEVVQVTRLMNVKGESTIFVFEVDEKLIKCDEVVIEEAAIPFVDMDAIKADVAIISEDMEEVVGDYMDCCRECEVVGDATIDILETIRDIDNLEELVDVLDCVLRDVYNEGRRSAVEDDFFEAERELKSMLDRL